MNNLNGLFGLGYCKVGTFTNSDLSSLKALSQCSVQLNVTHFLNIVLRHAVTSAKQGINFL